MSLSELLGPLCWIFEGLSIRIEKRWKCGSETITSVAYLVGVQEKL